MTANIDGQNWASSDFALQAQVGQFGVIYVQGSQFGRTMILTLYNIDQTGTYDLGMGATNVGGLAQVTDVQGTWTTPLSGQAGTVTISTLTPTRIAGTFSFDAEPFTGGATGTRSVTQGQFDMILAMGNNAWPLPDTYGNVLDGMVGGGTWKAATVVITLAGTTLVIGGNNTEYSISIGKTQYTGPGSFALGSQVNDPVVVMQGPSTNPTGPVNCCWTSSLPGASGTFTVTGQTATRIDGTLTATLLPMPGTAASGNLDISNLSFSIGIP